MYFSHPDVIITETDILLGAVETDSNEMSYLTLMEEAKIRIEGYIADEVKELMQEGTAHLDALKEVTDRVYNTLLFINDGRDVINSEEDLANAIVSSRNFEKWSTDVWINMKEIHRGMIKRNTPVRISNDKSIPQDKITEYINENGNLETVLSHLAMIFDVGITKASS